MYTGALSVVVRSVASTLRRVEATVHSPDGVASPRVRRSIGGMGVALEGPDGTKWYTAAEAEELLGYKPGTLHVYAQRGLITPVPFGNISVFNSREIESYVLRRRRPGRSPKRVAAVAKKRPRRAKA